eukprot:TRINITY_DN112322_c0_g1_i1.p1 TRINITY_DN112322_c0_g1~~TRINITY_DN112322_c0_g1_i1.p1  ORF type:complete len:530 (-),score=189.24 TRINITY_DN112322_c0_g1_i1:51-1604(-)
MAEAAGKRDIRAGSVSKVILEQSDMDLTGLRIGKQRLVSKKKRMSKLKQVILEDREYRVGELGMRPPQQAAKAIGVSQLSADAPAFLPSEWLLPEGVSTGDLAAELPVRTAAPPAPKPAGPLLPGKVESFMPDWCQSGSQAVPEAEAKEEDEEVSELTVSEAVERLKNLQDGGRKAPKEAGEAKQSKADIEVRHYVHQELSDELDERVKFVLSELVRFQERAKEQALKYAKLKRYCVGLREAKRAITRNKCKGLIVAPNLEVSNLEGGLDDTVEDVIDLARDNEIPVIFALSRNRIGKAMGKNIRLSIVALHSVEGVHKEFKDVVKLAEELRRRWVMRQMAHATSEYAEEAQRRAEEKAARDAARREAKERLEAERAAEEEKRREAAQAAKAAKAEAKAKKVAAQQAQAELRKAEKEAQEKERQEEQRKEDAKLEAERIQKQKVEQEKARKEQEAAKKAEQERRIAERKAEQEKQRRMAEAAAAKAAAGVQAEEQDEDSDADSSGSELPLGFNSQMF